MSCDICNGATVILLRDTPGGEHKIIRCPSCNRPEVNDTHTIWNGDSIDAAVQTFYSVADKAWLEQNPLP